MCVCGTEGRKCTRQKGEVRVQKCAQLVVYLRQKERDECSTVWEGEAERCSGRTSERNVWRRGREGRVQKCARPVVYLREGKGGERRWGAYVRAVVYLRQGTGEGAEVCISAIESREGRTGVSVRTVVYE